jgi:hypothetical protein
MEVAMYKFEQALQALMKKWEEENKRGYFYKSQVWVALFVLKEVLWTYRTINGRDNSCDTPEPYRKYEQEMMARGTCSCCFYEGSTYRDACDNCSRSKNTTNPNMVVFLEDHWVLDNRQ